MSMSSRPLSTQLRSGGGGTASAAQPPALVARIEEKKAELEQLREMRELSSAVAAQMEALEQKLSTLSDGTEGLSLHHSLFSPGFYGGPAAMNGEEADEGGGSHCNDYGELA